MLCNEHHIFMYIPHSLNDLTFVCSTSANPFPFRMGYSFVLQRYQKRHYYCFFFHKSQRPSFHASLFLPAQQCYLLVAAFVTQVVAVEAFPDAHSCLPALAAGINHISPSLMFAPYRAACACLLFLSQWWMAIAQSNAAIPSPSHRGAACFRRCASNLTPVLMIPFIRCICSHYSQHS